MVYLLQRYEKRFKTVCFAKETSEFAGIYDGRFALSGFLFIFAFN